MLKQLSRSLLIVGLLSVASGSAVAEGTSIEFAGVRHTPGSYGEGTFPELAPFQAQGKILSLAMLIHRDAGGLIAVDEEGSVLDSLVDDKGTDLIGKGAFGIGFGPFPKISEDGKAALWDITTKTQLDSAATSVTSKGTIHLQVATKKRKLKSSAIELAVGQAVDLEGYSFKISKVAKPSWGDGAVEVTLKTSKPASAMAGVQFFNGAGKSIETEPSGTSSSSFGKIGSYSYSFTLGKKPEKVVIELEEWEDMQTVEVPFEISAKVGGTAK